MPQVAIQYYALAFRNPSATLPPLLKKKNHQKSTSEGFGFQLKLPPTDALAMTLLHSLTLNTSMYHFLFFFFGFSIPSGLVGFASTFLIIILYVYTVSAERLRFLIP